MSVGVLRILFALIITMAAVIDDMKRYKISNRIITVGFVVAIGINMCDIIENGAVVTYLLAGVATFLIMLVAYGVMAVGAGDVKLCGVLGLLLGMDIMGRVLLLSFLYTGLVGTVWSIAGRTRRVKLAVGCVHTIHYSVALLIGQALGLVTMYTEVWI